MAGPTARSATALAVAAVAVVGLAAAGGALGATGSWDAPTATDPGPGDAVQSPATAASPAASGVDHGGDSPAARLECTNGTSPAVLACGYHPGVSAVSLAEQETAGRTVTVEAVDLREGGFVAVHAVSYVDGEFTESVLGVSSYREAGLHRDVQVRLDDELGYAGEVRLVAVAYRDTDGDRRFDFARTDGADDRPYTVSYTEDGGHVTDEAGDVVGDTAVVTRQRPAVARFDLDGDGEIEDSELDAVIRAYSDDEEIGGEPVTFADLITVIAAYNADGDAP